MGQASKSRLARWFWISAGGAGGGLGGRDVLFQKSEETLRCNDAHELWNFQRAAAAPHRIFCLVRGGSKKKDWGK